MDWIMLFWVTVIVGLATAMWFLTDRSRRQKERGISVNNRTWIGLLGFLAIATFLLWEEHRAHILGVLPWAILLLCPVLHLFLHRSHEAHEGDGGRGKAFHESGRADGRDGGGK